MENEMEYIANGRTIMENEYIIDVTWNFRAGDDIEAKKKFQAHMERMGWNDIEEWGSVRVVLINDKKVIDEIRY